MQNLALPGRIPVQLNDKLQQTLMEHLNKIIGKYRLTNFIGEGGMASVYEGTHEKLGFRVAVKILNPVLTANKQIRQRFENEARFMASLEHPNITRVLDYDEQPDMLAIIMELIKGQDLSTRIRSVGALGPEKATYIFSQILDAFQYAHNRGIIHRDIKPSNIFITPEDQVKILDFGIAKMIGSSDDFTQTGAQMGTPVYMSPEQVTADKTIDHRSDIYSLGVTLFFTLNGKPPYDNTTQSNFEIYNKIVYEPIPHLTQYPAIDEVISRAVNKKREQRFQSAEEFKSALIGVKDQPASPPDYAMKEKTIVDSTASSHDSNSSSDDKTMIDDHQEREKGNQEKHKKKETPKENKPDKGHLTDKSKKRETNKSNRLIIILAGVIALLVIVIFVWRTFIPSGPDKAELARLDSIRIADSMSRVRDEIYRQHMADSLREINRVRDSIQSIINDSVNKIRERYVGDHLFSCYFIGADEQFGKVTIQETDGVFHLNGKHEKQGNSVKIEGTIKILSLRKFEFTGTITAYNKSEANPSCVWKGTTLFWASGSRKYWRTQDQNCFTHTGDMDIYFNRSGT